MLNLSVFFRLSGVSRGQGFALFWLFYSLRSNRQAQSSTDKVFEIISRAFKPRSDVQQSTISNLLVFFLFFLIAPLYSRVWPALAVLNCCVLNLRLPPSIVGLFPRESLKRQLAELKGEGQNRCFNSGSGEHFDPLMLERSRMELTSEVLETFSKITDQWLQRPLTDWLSYLSAAPVVHRYVIGFKSLLAAFQDRK